MAKGGVGKKDQQYNGFGRHGTTRKASSEHELHDESFCGATNLDFRHRRGDIQHERQLLVGAMAGFSHRAR